MNKKYGNLYAVSTIKAGTYPGQTTDNKNTVVWNILVSNAKMSDQDAYNIVKTVFDKKADLVAVHGEAKNFTDENQVKDYSPIPWHPGAVKYFKRARRQDVIHAPDRRSQRPRLGGAVSLLVRVRRAGAPGQAEANEIAERAEHGDAEAHRPVGVIGDHQAEPGLGQAQAPPTARARSTGRW